MIANRKGLLVAAAFSASLAFPYSRTGSKSIRKRSRRKIQSFLHRLDRASGAGLSTKPCGSSLSGLKLYQVA